MDNSPNSKKLPGPNTRVINEQEQISPNPIKPEDADRKWEEFLGERPYTNIHPRTRQPDLNRLVSGDGHRSIRYGLHEMNSSSSKHHYHEEIWAYDSDTDTMTVQSTIVRVPLPKD